MDVNERIKLRRKELGLSADDVASALSVSRATIYRYESKEIEKVPTSALEPLAKILNTTPAYLMGWEEQATSSVHQSHGVTFNNIFSVKTKKVPLIGEVACGKPILCDQEYGYVDTELELSADFALRASGDSMINARILDGDIVFIHEQPIVNNGDIAAVIIDDSATLKRVYYYPNENKLVLVAENPQYEPLVYVGEELNHVRILGKAIAFQSNVR